MSGDRSPMSNEKLPNGASTALHQGRWSWRGGCSRQMLKTARQATHLCSWVPSMAWSIQSLQQVEACKPGTKREGETKTEESGGGGEASDSRNQNFPSPETKRSPPLERAPKRCKANLHGNAPSAIILLVSLQLYRSRGLSLSIFIQA